MAYSSIVVAAVSFGIALASAFIRTRFAPSDNPAAAGIRTGILVGFVVAVAVGAEMGDFTLLTNTVSSVCVIAGACIGAWLENRIY